MNVARRAGQLHPTVIELTKRSPFGKQLDWKVVGADLRPFHEQLEDSPSLGENSRTPLRSVPVGIGRRTLRNSDRNGSAPAP